MKQDAPRHSVDVANDVLNLLQNTDYIVQIILKPEGTFVKAGDASKKKAALVNVDLHRKITNNWLQDKIVAITLAIRLIKELRTK